MSYLDASYPLLTNATTTGDAIDWPGGRGNFSVYAGTFSGATVKLSWSPDGGSTYLDVDASGDTFVTKTAVGSGNFDLPPCKLKATVSSGPPSGMYAVVKGFKL